MSSRAFTEQDAEIMPTLVITPSTELLEHTAAICEPFLNQLQPPLQREKHIGFLTRMGLMAQLPRAFVSLDASRTWMMYWVLCALKLLGEDISPHRQRYVTLLFLPYFTPYSSSLSLS